MTFTPTSGLAPSFRSPVRAASGPSIGTPPPDTLPTPEPPPTIPVDHDDAFLHMMIANHQQGLKIAQVQVAKGRRADLRHEAASLIVRHNAEIDRLKKLKSRS
jgi:uncharacterized protein (DUF305 family)